MNKDETEENLLKPGGFITEWNDIINYKEQILIFIIINILRINNSISLFLTWVQNQVQIPKRLKDKIKMTFECHYCCSDNKCCFREYDFHVGPQWVFQKLSPELNSSPSHIQTQITFLVALAENRLKCSPVVKLWVRMEPTQPFYYPSCQIHLSFSPGWSECGGWEVGVPPDGNRRYR
jgi:hypothetical protein